MKLNDDQKGFFIGSVRVTNIDYSYDMTAVGSNSLQFYGACIHYTQITIRGIYFNTRKILYTVCYIHAT